MGAGKTLAGCVEAYLTALEYPGSVGLVARYSYGELFATTWDCLKQLVPKPLQLRISESPGRMFMDILAPKGKVSRIWGWNGSNWKNLTSLNLDWFFLDEVTEWPNQDVWKQLCGRLRRKVGPRRGWCTGTPAGRDWVWKLFVKHHYRGYKYVRAKTSENPYLPDGYEEDLRAGTAREWQRQFLDADFIECEGMVLHNYDETVHVIQRFQVPRHWPRYRGLDPGVGAPMACMLIAMDELGNAYVTDEVYEPNLTIGQQVQKIQQMTGHLETVWTAIDPNAGRRRDDVTGRALIDEYHEAGLRGLILGNDNLTAGIAHLQQLLEVDPNREHPRTGQMGSPRLFIFSNCVNLRAEGSSWHWGKRGKPEGDDHALDATRYALMRRPAPAVPRIVETMRPDAAEFWASRQVDGLGVDLPAIGAGPRGALDYVEF